MECVKISVYSRIHLSLLAMHAGGCRINGGLGFGIAQPSCDLNFNNSTKFLVNDLRPFPLDNSEQQRLLLLLEKEQHRCGFSKCIEVTIQGNMRPHSGFGSGTSTSLACLEALHLLNGAKPLAAELVAASGRGGTSGIGIHSYFAGGFVFDLGRANHQETHMPSHQAATARLPLLLDQKPMPDWQVGVCIPLKIPHKTQAEERAFFERTCPLPSAAVYETVYHALFGLYAAILEADRPMFCLALRAVQACAWKHAERQEYGTSLIDIEQSLYAAGAEGVGMSSLGPSLFFLGDNLAAIIQKMRQVHPDCEWLLTHPDNSGRAIIND